MILPHILTALALACCLWAVFSAIRISVYLERHGLKTPWFLLKYHFFRNLKRYREMTLDRRGRPGPLYYSFLVPINAAWMLALAALALRRILP